MTVYLERGYKRKEPCGPKQYHYNPIREIYYLVVFL